MRPLLPALFVATAIALGAGAGSAGPATSAASPVAASGMQLLMVEQRGCVHCRAWDREIAPGYAATPEGRAAPLLRVNIRGPWPDGLALDRRPYVTPTFILLRDSQEMARIEGYPGSGRFYPMMAAMLRGAGAGGAPAGQ